jgi:hypothetical protein
MWLKFINIIKKDIKDAIRIWINLTITIVIGTAIWAFLFKVLNFNETTSFTISIIFIIIIIIILEFYEIRTNKN